MGWGEGHTAGCGAWGGTAELGGAGVRLRVTDGWGTDQQEVDVQVDRRPGGHSMHKSTAWAHGCAETNQNKVHSKAHHTTARPKAANHSTANHGMARQARGLSAGAPPRTWARRET